MRERARGEAHLLHKRGQLVRRRGRGRARRVGGRCGRGALFVQRQSLVELGQVAALLGARGAGGGGVGLVLARGQRALQLAALRRLRGSGRRRRLVAKQLLDVRLRGIPTIESRVPLFFLITSTALLRLVN